MPSMATAAARRRIMKRVGLTGKVAHDYGAFSVLENNSKGLYWHYGKGRTVVQEKYIPSGAIKREQSRKA